MDWKKAGIIIAMVLGGAVAEPYIRRIPILGEHLPKMRSV